MSSVIAIVIIISTSSNFGFESVPCITECKADSLTVNRKRLGGHPVAIAHPLHME